MHSGLKTDNQLLSVKTLSMNFLYVCTYTHTFNQITLNSKLNFSRKKEKFQYSFSVYHWIVFHTPGGCIYSHFGGLLL